MNSGNGCKKCGDCCRRYPCSLVPDDLSAIANYLNIGIEELFKKYLVIDYWEGEERQYYICPARKDNEIGQVVSWGWAFSGIPCIFLENNLCKIHPVKPHLGKISNCKGSKGHDKLWYANLWRTTDFIKNRLEDFR